MPQKIKNRRPRINLEAEALAALEQARAMEPGPERTDAMKRAGILGNAAELQELFFMKREDGRKPEAPHALPDNCRSKEKWQ